MKNYLNRHWDFESSEVVSAYDELPLWSAKPGFLLLENIDYTIRGEIADIGSGTGFPLLEIAERFGNEVKIYSVDPWKAANHRIQEKILQYDIENVELRPQNATDLPFDSNSLDLITSNLGINNFEEKEKVLNECFRVLKIGGKLAVTSNFKGHFDQFYQVFESVLNSLGLESKIEELRNHIESRGSAHSLKASLRKAGFEIEKESYETFDMTFASGTAFLRHHFISLGFLESWKNIASTMQNEIFKKIEIMLNDLASSNSGFKVSVPIGFIQGSKRQNNESLEGNSGQSLRG